MVEKSMGAALRFFEKVGHRINNAVQRLGFAARGDQAFGAHLGKVLRGG